MRALTTRCVLAWLIALLMLAPAHSQAREDAITARAYLRDATGQLSLDQARGQAFTPYAGLLTQGYQRNATYWLRLTVRGADPSGAPFVLRVRPIWHDEIELYDPADPQQQARVQGDQYPWSAREWPSLAYTFLLPKADVDREIYLRVRSVHTYLLDVQAVEQESARRIDWGAQAIYSVFICAQLMVLIWAAASLAARPERVIAWFTAYQLAQVIYVVMLVGFGHAGLDGIVPTPWIDPMTTTSVILSSLAGLQFHRAMLGEYPLMTMPRRALALVSWIPAVALVVFAAGESTWALELNAAALLGSAIACFAGIWLVNRGERRADTTTLPRWTLLLFYTALLIVAGFGAVPLLGWVRGVDVTLHAFLWHGALVTVVMGFLIQHRARQMREQQLSQLTVARERAEQEQRARKELGQFMAMLNHELKTPMAVLKMMLAEHPVQRQAEAQIDTMTALLDRCLMADQLEHPGTRPAQIQFAPASVISEAIARCQAPSRVVLTAVSAQVLESDPELYGVIVGNLLDNAIKYSPAGSTVEVSLTEERHVDRVLVRLAVDNETGRAGAPDPARVFSKYYRSEAALAIPGTGLGLYLVRSLTDLLGGEAGLEVSAGRVRVSVVLPLARAGAAGS